MARRFTTSATAWASARSVLQEFQPGRRGKEQVRHLDPRAAIQPRRAARGASGRHRRGWTSPCGAPLLAGGDGEPRHRRRWRAAPRRESRACAMSKRSPSGSLDVAWRSTASSRSSGVMPAPSSTTRISRRPPPSSTISIRRAPASSAFSTSSFTADAGRSTTSPAAMRSTRTGSSLRTASPAPALKPDYSPTG